MGFSSDYTAVAAGHINYNGIAGSSGAPSADANFGAEVPLNNEWFMPMGITSCNLFLGGVPGVPIPDTIDTLGLNVGLGYHVNDQWTVAAALGPRIYRVDSIDSSGIGIGGMARATYK